MAVERRRSTYELECGRKYVHQSRADALIHANRLDGLEPYHCIFCRRWHVGHPRAHPLAAPPTTTAQKERRAWRRSRRRWVEKNEGTRRAGE